MKSLLLLFSLVFGFFLSTVAIMLIILRCSLLCIGLSSIQHPLVVALLGSNVLG